MHHSSFLDCNYSSDHSLDFGYCSGHSIDSHYIASLDRNCNSNFADRNFGYRDFISCNHSSSYTSHNFDYPDNANCSHSSSYTTSRSTADCIPDSGLDYCPIKLLVGPSAINAPHSK